MAASWIRLHPGNTDSHHPPAEGVISRIKINPEDIVITYTCCEYPVKLGTLKQDEIDAGFVLLDRARVRCPMSCPEIKGTCIRQPKSVISPSCAACMDWRPDFGCVGGGPYFRDTILYLENYFVKASDIVRGQGTYPISELDVQYMSTIKLYYGWRAYIQETEEHNLLKMAKIVKMKPGVAPAQKIDHPFPFKQDEWSVIETSDTPIKMIRKDDIEEVCIWKQLRDALI